MLQSSFMYAFLWLVPRFNTCHSITLKSVGSNALVWVDEDMGVIFKQFPDFGKYEREFKFYKKLGWRPWLSTVLGIGRTDKTRGIYLTYEGNPVSHDEWDEVGPHLTFWLSELHATGIHHHDMAPRNILRRVNGTLVLIDFENAVEENDCDLGDDCPDKCVQELWTI